MISLEGITLPDDLQWIDEFSGFGVGQTVTPTLTGALVVQENAQPAGRSITLQSNGAAWVSRAVIEQLAVLASTPLDDETLSLVWADGRTFTVVFDRGAGGFSASEVLRLGAGAQDGAHPYEITLNLITV